MVTTVPRAIERRDLASYWPNAPAEEQVLAQPLNATSPRKWQTLREQRGRNIQVIGSPTLVRSLLRDGLLDELGLLVHPLVVGSGKRLFAELSFGTALELVDSRTLGSGVLFLTYTPAGRGGGRQRVIRRPTVAIGRRA